MILLHAMSGVSKAQIEIRSVIASGEGQGVERGGRTTGKGYALSLGAMHSKCLVLVVTCCV